jgi:hypothetical protein
LRPSNQGRWSIKAWEGNEAACVFERTTVSDGILQEAAAASGGEGGEAAAAAAAAGELARARDEIRRLKEKMSKDKVKRREDTRKDLSRFTTDTQLELEREKMEFETRATEVSTLPSKPKNHTLICNMHKLCSTPLLGMYVSVRSGETEGSGPDGWLCRRRRRRNSCSTTSRAYR